MQVAVEVAAADQTEVLAVEVLEIRREAMVQMDLQTPVAVLEVQNPMALTKLEVLAVQE
jgi:hypothetical protein